MFVIVFRGAAPLNKTVQVKYSYDATSLGFPGWNMFTTALKENLTYSTSTSSSFYAVKSTCGTGVNLVGGYQKCSYSASTSCYLTKTFTNLPSHNYMSLEMLLYWIDGWSGQFLYISADNVNVFAQKKWASETTATSARGLDTASSLCGSSANDDYGTMVTSFYHNKSSLTLKVYSSVTSTSIYWGVASMTVEVGLQGTMRS